MEEEVKKGGSNKVYNVLSYIGILWLVGILCSNKDEEDVKFHVGQGMLLTVLSVIIYIINNFIIANIFTTTTWWGIKTTSGLGLGIMWILNFIPLIYAILGIINAAKEEQKELPFIGKYAFYKK